MGMSMPIAQADRLRVPYMPSGRRGRSRGGNGTRQKLDARSPSNAPLECRRSTVHTSSRGNAGEGYIGIEGDDETLASLKSKPVGDTIRSETDSTESTDELESAASCDCDAIRGRGDEVRSDVDVLVELALDYVN